jgi:thymidylate kinase
VPEELMKLSRDVIIEFAGMPKSGKTTVLDITAHYLRRQKLPVAEFHGGGRYAPVGKSDLPELNVYLACEAIRYVLAADQLYREPRIHLMDRGIIDRMIFTLALNSIGRLSDEQRDCTLGVLGLPEVVSKVDKTLVFVTDPQLSLSREVHNKLSASDGRVMNTPLLTALQTAAETWQQSAARIPPTITVDTAVLDGDIQRTAFTVLTGIAGVLRSAGIEIELPEISARKFS